LQSRRRQLEIERLQLNAQTRYQLLLKMQPSVPMHVPLHHSALR
jgi:hypothetical protein